MTGDPGIPEGQGDEGEAPAKATHVPLSKAQRRERARLVAGLVVGALVAAFALLNLDDVKVNWIVGTDHTPLIVVVAVAFLCGMVIDRLIARAKRRRARG